MDVPPSGAFAHHPHGHGPAVLGLGQVPAADAQLPVQENAAVPDLRRVGVETDGAEPGRGLDAGDVELPVLQRFPFASLHRPPHPEYGLPEGVAVHRPEQAVVGPHLGELPVHLYGVGNTGAVDQTEDAGLGEVVVNASGDVELPQQLALLRPVRVRGINPGDEPLAL